MRLTLLLLSFIVLSCNKMDVEKESNVLNCIGEINDLETETCETDSITSEGICDFHYIGSYTLPDESIQYLPQYCCELNTLIEYKNSEGEIIEFKLTDKDYLRKKSGYKASDWCEDGSLRRKGICLSHDEVFIEMHAVDLALELLICVKTVPDVSYLEDPKIGDILEVYKNDPHRTGDFDFLSIINQRTLNNGKFSLEEHFENIELNGETFNDVISNKVPEYYDKFRYYFNKDKGMIGFEDDDGVLWTIND